MHGNEPDSIAASAGFVRKSQSFQGCDSRPGTLGGKP